MHLEQPDQSAKIQYNVNWKTIQTFIVRFISLHKVKDV